MPMTVNQHHVFLFPVLTSADASQDAMFAVAVVLPHDPHKLQLMVSILDITGDLLLTHCRLLLTSKSTRFDNP